jgi:hypothetical protein
MVNTKTGGKYYYTMWVVLGYRQRKEYTTFFNEANIIWYKTGNTDITYEYGYQKNKHDSTKQKSNISEMLFLSTMFQKKYNKSCTDLWRQN